MTQNGQAFELPTPEPLTKGLESSSSPTLATPNTFDSLPPRYGEAYERVKNAGGRKNRKASGNLREQVVHVLPTPRANEPGSTSPGYGDSLSDFASRQANGFARKDLELFGTVTTATSGRSREFRKDSNPNPYEFVADMKDLLRTPAASEGERGHQTESVARARGGQVTLSGQMLELFPTPNTMEHREIKTPEQIQAMKDKSPGGYRNLRESVINELPETDWGKFEPAIRRWEEVLGRPAPAPTKPDGKDNGHRLSSLFTEWLMGLPEGWITGLGLKRNDELKLGATE